MTKQITPSFERLANDNIQIILGTLSLADAQHVLQTSKKMQTAAREVFPQIDEIYATLRSLSLSLATRVARQYTFLNFLSAKDSIIANQALLHAWPELRANLLDPTRHAPRLETPPQKIIPNLPSETANPIAIRSWLNNSKNQVHLKKVLYLCLSGLGLRELPKEIQRFRRLRKLNVSSNQLTTVPLWLKKFRKLTHLILDQNRISKLHNSLRLKNLEVLSMRKITSLTTFPKAISQFFKLQELDLTECCYIHQFPKRFLPPPSLQRVDPPHRLKSAQAQNWFEYLRDAISYEIETDEEHGFSRDEAFAPRN